MTDDRILKANLDALRKKTPTLAAAVEAHTVNVENLSFVQTRDGVPSVRYRHWNGDREVNTWIHSQYHPIAEAKRFAAAVNDTPNLVLYGFGLGYHVQALVATRADSGGLRIMECNLDLLKSAFAGTDFTDLIAMPGVEFINGLDPLNALDTLQDAQTQTDWAESKLIVYRPAANCLDDGYLNLRLFLTSQVISGVTDERQKLAASNHYANVQLCSQPVQQLFGKHPNATAFIVSSGPSLNTHWRSIQQHRPSSIVLCAGSSLRFLIGNQIVPDYILLMDALSNVQHQMKGCESLSVPLVFSNFTNHAAVQSYQGPKYMYLCEPVDGFPEAQVLSVGGSVATAAVTLALKMGMRRLIFIGQDLSWPGGRHHVSGDLHGKRPYMAELPFYDREKNVHGEWVTTRTNMLKYRQWFEKTIAGNPDVQFFNLTDNGLPIAGAPAVSQLQLSQIIDAEA